jgi:predicted Abi (CAAX) family protease
MNEQLIISLILLSLVLLDAIGDAFRFRGWNIPHHIMEVFHVAGWITLWALFGFQVIYIPLYILGRIILFDIVFNLTAGLKIGHIGTSSLYDIILTKFGGWVSC